VPPVARVAAIRGPKPAGRAAAAVRRAASRKSRVHGAKAPAVRAVMPRRRGPWARRARGVGLHLGERTRASRDSSYAFPEMNSTAAGVDVRQRAQRRLENPWRSSSHFTPDTAAGNSCPGVPSRLTAAAKRNPPLPVGGWWVSSWSQRFQPPAARGLSFINQSAGAARRTLPVRFLGRARCR